MNGVSDPAPWCGVVDHISCHALGEADGTLAAKLAQGLGAGIGDELNVPVLLYGLASPAGNQLADLRRKNGYFKETAKAGGWVGAHEVEGGCVQADYGRD